MKKHLFTCFLASLCLYGSEIRAQSRVAESPITGADFLHRSMPQVSSGVGDTHRGGDARPDTLTPLIHEDNTAEVIGQEGERASAGWDGYFTLRGEISPDVKSHVKISYELIQRELDPYYQLMDVQTGSPDLENGEFYAGTSGKLVFEQRIPVEEAFARFNLSDGPVPLLENIWVQPGDSLVVHWNPKRKQLFLSGPTAAKVRLQRQLKELALAESAGRNPVMLISDAKLMLNSAEKQSDYEEVSSRYSSGWNRKMEWLETEDQRRGRAAYLFSAIPSHPVFGEIYRYEDLLGVELSTWLRLYWKGILYKSAFQFVRNCRPEGKEWGEILLRHGMEVASILSDWSGKTIPNELAEALYLENSQLEKLIPVSFFHLSEAIPVPAREQVDALFLVRSYKDLAEADSLFDQVQRYINIPWLTAHLDELQHANLIGQAFSDHGFLDADGQMVYPEEWKGSLVFLDFWLSGCGACLGFAGDTFLPLMKEFEAVPGIRFVTVSGDTDPDVWQKSLASGRYTSSQSINLFSGGVDHPTLRQNLIRSFPAQVLLDREGRILQPGGFPKSLEGWSRLVRTYLHQEPDTSRTIGSVPHSEVNPKSSEHEK